VTLTYYYDSLEAIRVIYNAVALESKFSFLISRQGLLIAHPLLLSRVASFLLSPLALNNGAVHITMPWSNKPNFHFRSAVSKTVTKTSLSY
jgi:hypothetical protein